jgi:phosphopantetheinyl transferase (holo-ACP synthase)
VAQDRQKGVVQTLRLAPGGGLVYYVSAPESATAGSAGAARQSENRCRLAALLCEHLRAQATTLWNNHPFCDSAEGPLQITHDALGCPGLVRGEHAGPSVSFSRAGEEVWAALAGDGSDVGIDVAGNAEFRGDYPVRRVFHAQEIEQVLNVAGGDVDSALALLWSIKEAVAKALGCAFHLAEPLDIHVQPSAAEGDWQAFSASLSGKASVRFPLAGGQTVSVCSEPQADAWLSIAAVLASPCPLSGPCEKRRRAGYRFPIPR